MPKVTFHSPGTFVSEDRDVETELTDPKQIQKLAENIVERYGATPFGFTIEGDDRFYWIGKTELLSYDDVPDTPENRILRWNMRMNHITHVVRNTNSWAMTSAYRPNLDVILSDEVQP